ncbi:MAG: carboxymuconolactone decarboxylase family protein [Novosphingobium sp.]
MQDISLSFLRNEAERACAEIDEGAPLDELSAALVGLAVAVSVTLLDRDLIEAGVSAAFDAGASVEQVQEIIALSSGLGVHSLMASSVPVLNEAARRGLLDERAPMDDIRQALWDKHIGHDPFWVAFSEHVPGFLDAMLRLSPDIFVGFFEYCAIPWKSGTVRARVKELAALACDATPSHRFAPGFRAHLSNAIRLGVGRKAILQTLDIAARAPDHSGYDKA